MKSKFSKLFFSMLILLLVLVSAVAIWPVQPVVANGGLPGARHALGGKDGKELFLGGNYIELGISQWGEFGTEGAKPAGFYGTAVRSNIGMSADHDGFNQGFDHRVDYFLPDTPEERFAVGYKVGTSTYSTSNCAMRGDKNMPTVITDESSGDLLKATIVSTWAGAMQIKQVISFAADQKFFRNEVTIKNISDTDWSSARYMRSVDPDNTVDVNPDPSFDPHTTDNTVTHTVAQDGKAVVKAQTFDASDPIYKDFGSRAPIFFYSRDTAGVASACAYNLPYAEGNDGFTNTNPYDKRFYETPSARNDTIQEDAAITITFDTGRLNSGGSKTFVYYTSLDERDFSEVEKDVEQDEEEEIAAVLPEIRGIEPDSGLQGQTLTVTITGKNFSGVSQISFGEGITVNSFVVLSLSKIEVEISIGSAAATGARDVSLTTAAGTDIFEDGFTVRSLPRPKPWEGLSEAPSMASPADISTRNVRLDSQQVSLGETVTVYANVVNDGNLPGTYSVVLRLNGEVVETQEVTVPGNQAVPVTFTVKPSKTGTYQVDISGQVAGFVVSKAKGIPGSLIALMVSMGLVFLVLVYILLRKRLRRYF